MVGDEFMAFMDYDDAERELTRIEERQAELRKRVDAALDRVRGILLRRGKATVHGRKHFALHAGAIVITPVGYSHELDEALASEE